MGGRADFLCPFIWSPDAMPGLILNLAKEQHTILEKSVMETLAMIRQVFEEENMSHTWEVQTQ
jgi:hypothetical protein